MKPRKSKVRAESCNKPLNPEEVSLLKGNPHRHKPIKKFMDKPREMSERYFAFLEEAETADLSVDSMIRKLKHMIDADPDFLDPYLYLAELYYEDKKSYLYANIIYDAYLRAVNMVADKSGNYPKELPWGWIENRHIVRTLSNFALLQWEQGDVRLALEIYRKLLASHINDNIGARYAILALRLGYNPDYEALFLPDTEPAIDLDVVKSMKWFDRHSKQFPEEFATFNDYAKSSE